MGHRRLHLPISQIFLSIFPELTSENPELMLVFLLPDSDVARSFCRHPNLPRRKKTLLYPAPFFRHRHRVFLRWPEYSKFRSVQSLSHVWLFATPWTAALQASRFITISRSSPKPMSLESVIAIQPSHPLSSPSPSALNLSQHQGLFQWVSSSQQMAKVLS